MATKESKAASAIGAAGLSLAALGVVFGDIGTSPLYTLKTVLNLAGANPDTATTLGALSLILWTLFLVTGCGPWRRPSRREEKEELEDYIAELKEALQDAEERLKDLEK